MKCILRYFTRALLLLVAPALFAQTQVNPGQIFCPVSTVLVTLQGCVAIGAGLQILPATATTPATLVAIATGGISVQNFADGEILTPLGTSFTLINPPISGSVHLFRNGIRQASPGDYTIAGKVITFVKPPLVTDLLIADYRY